jgi:carbonic anhydrase/acetyltransferase-like protein (isoleucine patch superfamily)
MTDDKSRVVFRSELVHASVFIASGARVMGEVTLEEDASVWFNAVLRGDTETVRVGRRTNVQDLCMLHADPGFPCILGEGVTVGHGAIVHGARIGDNVVVGMHSVVMNGATIGADSIVAVGAVVTEGTEVPPRSLVMGVPGRIKRALTDDEVQRNRMSAEHYVQAARAFRSG